MKTKEKKDTENKKDSRIGPFHNINGFFTIWDKKVKFLTSIMRKENLLFSNWTKASLEKSLKSVEQHLLNLLVTLKPE